MKQLTKKILVTMTLMASLSAVHAAFPDQPIKLVVPFPAGGTTDVLARTLAVKLSERVGQSVVVENRAGAGGTIAALAVARSAPDGYTFILGTFGTHAVNHALAKNPSYHPLNDFSAITTVAEVPNVLVVSSKSPYKTVAELIAAAKAKPGELSHASTGIGASPSLSFNVLSFNLNSFVNSFAFSRNINFFTFHCSSTTPRLKSLSRDSENLRDIFLVDATLSARIRGSSVSLASE
jgi:tripartite-type tricarboxylate transporter receptor subunit TctC